MSFYLFIVLFYFVLLFIMHMFVVLILPAYKWLPLFAADVKINFLTKLFIFSNIRPTNECRQCCCFYLGDEMLQRRKNDITDKIIHIFPISYKKAEQNG